MTEIAAPTPEEEREIRQEVHLHLNCHGDFFSCTICKTVAPLLTAWDAAIARWTKAEKTLEAIATFVYFGEGMPEDVQSIYQQLEQDGFNEEWLRQKIREVV